MNIPSTFAKFLQRDTQQSRIHALEQNNFLLTRQLGNLITEVQAATDITTNTDSTSVRTYVGTPTRYNNYLSQVRQLGYLYDNTADWGCMMAKNIIDVRTAFSVGAGIRVEKRKEFEGDATAELAWVKEFIRFNNLDEEMPQEYAKEAEIEGKVLLRFFVDENARNIRVAHTPWRQYQYIVETPAYDFFNYIRAYYNGTNEPKVTFDLAAPWFVYRRFGGSSNKVNETPPKTAYVLRQIEDLDKAIFGWRKINRLFSAPTPTFYAPDKQTASDINKWLDESNWRMGKAITLGGQGVKFELVGWKGDGFTTLKAETETLVKTISGTTGIPVHFLGYPELLSNRDTAENLSELIALSTTKERRTWIGAYEELFQKAMMIANAAFGLALNPMAVDATIEESSFEEKPNEAVSESGNSGTEQ